MAQRSRAGRPAAGPRRSARGESPRGDTGQGPQAPGLAAHRARLREVVAPVVEQAGYDLEDLAVSRAGRRHLLRVTVDGDEGVSLDAVAELSRQISAALDDAEATGGEFTTGEYVLEVGSPGVDRPLTEPRHWRRNVGRLVAVRAEDRQVTARVVAADADRVTLEADGRRVDHPYDRLGPGRVQIEFGRLDEVGDDELADFEEEREEDEE